MSARHRSVTAGVVVVAVGAVVLAGAMGTTGAVGASTVRPISSSTPPAATVPVPDLPTAQNLTVLAPLNPAAPVPSRAGLTAALAGPLASPALGPTTAVAIYDAATGVQLLDQAASTPATPASTNKLLTAASVLTAVGADQRVSTKVVRGSASSELVLVGGGDPLLKIAEPKATEDADASLAHLAAEAAAAVKAAGSGVTQPVSVRFDDALFSGPTAVASWPPGFPMPPITALMADGGYRASGQSDPSKSAAMAFAKLLGANGVSVSKTVTRQAAAGGAALIASVASRPVSELVLHTLDLSDNVAAEVLAHLAGAKTGAGGSFSGGVDASLAVLRSLNIPTDSVTLVDGSGLSRSDQIPPTVLARLLSSVARNANPQLWAVASGTPIAGFTGTLANRFKTAAAAPGAGVVRAKTGTLSGVGALAGLVPTKDGALLAFSMVAPNAKDVLVAEAQLDQAAAALSSCGCRP
ncbi:MAG: D-alanyl-D-alanine carboxypeptidase/D-alanyl-D-alanine-endopeptidase [Actinomycetes bacterium]